MQISGRKVMILILIVIFLSQVKLFVWLFNASWTAVSVRWPVLGLDLVKYPLWLVGLILIWLIIFSCIFKGK